MVVFLSQDVNTVLRSMPVIGPWTPSGLPRSAWVGMGMYGGEDDATGFHFDEKAFVIDPDVLLAMDEVRVMSFGHLCLVCASCVHHGRGAFEVNVIAFRDDGMLEHGSQYTRFPSFIYLPESPGDRTPLSILARVSTVLCATHFVKGLASKRQLLVLCDRECAAAAEALAEKVSEAGGLEPRLDPSLLASRRCRR